MKYGNIIGSIATVGAVGLLFLHLETTPKPTRPQPIQVPDYRGTASSNSSDIPPEPNGGTPPPEGTFPPGSGDPNENSSIQNFQDYFGNLPNQSSRSNSAINLTTYGYVNDPYMDSNTAIRKGFRENWLTDQAVALSPDLVTQYGLRGGEAVYIDGNFIGYYEDKTSSALTRTVDVFDPSGSVGSVLKHSNGQLSFGPGRPLTPWAQGNAQNN